MGEGLPQSSTGQSHVLHQESSTNLRVPDWLWGPRLQSNRNREGVAKGITQFAGKGPVPFQGLRESSQTLAFPCGLKQTLPPVLASVPKLIFGSSSRDGNVSGVWDSHWKHSWGSVGLTTVSPLVVGLAVSHMRAVGCGSSANDDRWFHCNSLRGRW